METKTKTQGSFPSYKKCIGHALGRRQVRRFGESAVVRKGKNKLNNTRPNEELSRCQKEDTFWHSHSCDVINTDWRTEEHWQIRPWLLANPWKQNKWARQCLRAWYSQVPDLQALRNTLLRPKISVAEALPDLARLRTKNQEQWLN